MKRPHIIAVGRLHAVEISAAWAKIHFRGGDGKALRTPPFRHALRLRQRLPEERARGIEAARDDERVLVRFDDKGAETRQRLPTTFHRAVFADDVVALDNCLEAHAHCQSRLPFFLDE